MERVFEILSQADIIKLTQKKKSDEVRKDLYSPAYLIFCRTLLCHSWDKRTTAVRYSSTSMASVSDKHQSSGSPEGVLREHQILRSWSYSGFREGTEVAVSSRAGAEGPCKTKRHHSNRWATQTLKLHCYTWTVHFSGSTPSWWPKSLGHYIGVT